MRRSASHRWSAIAARTKLMTTAPAPHASSARSACRASGRVAIGIETNRPVGALVWKVMAGRILVGTSSWADPGFVEDWYPRGMAARDRLGWYAQRFEYVEVNSSFYAVPAPKTVVRWAEITPDDFTFDVKLHRLL